MITLFKRPNESSILHAPVADDMEAPLTLVATNEGVLDAWVELEGELALDVYVTDSDVVVRTAVAGVAPEAMSIALHNDLLTIRGRREEEPTSGERRYLLQECHWGPFSRSVVLPVPVKADATVAVMKHGVLTVTLQRAEPSTVAIQEVDN